jgi:hypothetical protein
MPLLFYVDFYNYLDHLTLRKTYEKLVSVREHSGEIQNSQSPRSKLSKS